MKLTHTPMVVRSQDEALRFYSDVLGFETRADYQLPGHPRWLTVAPTGDEVELILVEGVYSVDPRPAADADSGGNHHVFVTDDCRRDFETLKARGVRFKNDAPVEAPYGISAYFTDPDGNHLTLLQPRQATRQ
ncbi:MAG: VOC family protein [Chloroflexi bacterium]|nr:VOC family protein [Chloroflexota bacterium]MBV9597775.1 VOC family protein [Chloroflexota bacterium]